MTAPEPKAEQTQPFLPYGRQIIEDDDIAAVTDALRGDYLTTGPLVTKFETALKDCVRADHAVVCSNGTAALYMAAKALGLGPGSTVIVPSITFLATASAPHMAGAEIVFADVDPDSGLMRPTDLEAALTRAGGKADAVFNVHLNGQCGAVEAIAQIAREHGLNIVDDASHAIGTRYRIGAEEKLVGENALSDMTTFSFHPVKTVTMGEGGAVTTNDPKWAEALRLCRNHGMTRDPAHFQTTADAFAAPDAPNPWYYELEEPGFNWRATDIQCALGISQLNKLSRFMARRKALAAAYDCLLAPLSPVVQPVSHTDCAPTLHLYPVLIDFAAVKMSRAEVMAKLAAEGIGSQVHYYPVHRQRYYAARYGITHLPGADAYYARALSIPFYASMTISDATRVVQALKLVLGL
ncbi:UDP-4-amino-4,6-dideoxy-N-acetyl-beta-L-altrosamine transaminase [Rhizomicrobium palustre]|uniref:UDP-4-amino-4, 6-dideoxy-N-acetyl-beta-L-altrosamine transaminase n=1 Tax=Rhizomicrobium palustre TaxID=189966 RepID=A0A846MYK7_9PROT|nr:UDP-4-amino-4,6-dideoxy-N-acetyl-beta-L-altrosamine transaminase [Rhizomicrobium palustre]NIK88070.1 UDP-4-amino-4,6-dideoxy-N-acetyl-beta-L-altrosamine transaminase [Rhizomicrobium palustre]